MEADLRYPIILSADGGLMDGEHRVAEAFLLHLPTVATVQFPVDPEPDAILPQDAPLPSEPRQPIPSRVT